MNLSTEKKFKKEMNIETRIHAVELASRIPNLLAIPNKRLIKGFKMAIRDNNGDIQDDPDNKEIEPDALDACFYGLLKDMYGEIINACTRKMEQYKKEWNDMKKPIIDEDDNEDFVIKT
jgi:hypothetical protein